MANMTALAVQKGPSIADYRAWTFSHLARSEMDAINDYLTEVANKTLAAANSVVDASKAIFSNSGLIVIMQRLTFIFIFQGLKTQCIRLKQKW